MYIKEAKYEGGKLILTASQEARKLVYGFKPGEYDITPTEKKRSLDANAYAWRLMTKIGNEVRRSKEEVYLDMLKRYGQSEMVSVREDVDVKGYFKYYEEAGSACHENIYYTYYKVYKGSSEYDTREMSILIDGIVSEAKDLDIETLTPEKLERMKSEWQ